jgi:hypothetical protein
MKWISSLILQCVTVRIFPVIGTANSNHKNKIHDVSYDVLKMKLKKIDTIYEKIMSSKNKPAIK